MGGNECKGCGNSGYAVRTKETRGKKEKRRCASGDVAVIIDKMTISVKTVILFHVR